MSGVWELYFAAVLYFYRTSNLLYHGAAPPSPAKSISETNHENWPKHLAHFSPKFTRRGGNTNSSLNLWPNSPLSRLYFETKQLRWNLKELRQQQWSIWFMSCFNLTSEIYWLVGSFTTGRKMCWVVNNSAMHCPILLKFGTMMQGFM